jgi:hypothetical protein
VVPIVDVDIGPADGGLLDFYENVVDSRFRDIDIGKLQARAGGRFNDGFHGFWFLAEYPFDTLKTSRILHLPPLSSKIIPSRIDGRRADYGAKVCPSGRGVEHADARQR